MNLFSVAKVAAGLAVSATILAACTVVVDEGPGYRPGPSRPGPAPQACTREFDPVCGQRGGQQRTFGNACMARADGFQLAHPGECRPAMRPGRPGGDWERPGRPGRPGSEWDRPGRPGGGDAQRPGRPQQACTMDYRPVCAVRGDQRRTFGNACSADAEGFRVIGEGECGPQRRDFRS